MIEEDYDDKHVAEFGIVYNFFLHRRASQQFVLAKAELLTERAII